MADNAEYQLNRLAVALQKTTEKISAVSQAAGGGSALADAAQDIPSDRPTETVDLLNAPEFQQLKIKLTEGLVQTEVLTPVIRALADLAEAGLVKAAALLG